MPWFDLYRLCLLAAGPHRFVVISIAIVAYLSFTLRVRPHAANCTLPQRGKLQVCKWQMQILPSLSPLFAISDHSLAIFHRLCSPTPWNASRPLFLSFVSIPLRLPHFPARCLCEVYCLRNNCCIFSIMFQAIPHLKCNLISYPDYLALLFITIIIAILHNIHIILNNTYL